MKDSYRENIIQKHLERMKQDEFHIPRITGTTGIAPINLDEGALQLLSDYYKGKLHIYNMPQAVPVEEFELGKVYLGSDGNQYMKSLYSDIAKLNPGDANPIVLSSTTSEHGLWDFEFRTAEELNKLQFIEYKQQANAPYKDVEFQILIGNDTSPRLLEELYGSDLVKLRDSIDILLKKMDYKEQLTTTEETEYIERD